MVAACVPSPRALEHAAVRRLVLIYARVRDVARLLGAARRVPSARLRPVLASSAHRVTKRLPPWWRYADPAVRAVGAVLDDPAEYVLRAPGGVPWLPASAAAADLAFWRAWFRGEVHPAALRDLGLPVLPAALPPGAAAVLEVLRRAGRPLRRGEVVSACRQSKRTVGRALRRLRALGLVGRVRRGLWAALP